MAVAATYHWGGGSTTAWRWPPAALHPADAGLGAPTRPGSARCHLARTLNPAAAARRAGECGDPVPRLAMPGPAAKKTSLHATAREPPRVQHARTRYRQRTATLDSRRLKCVDEAGVNLAMTRLYGRAPKGARVLGTVPQHDGDHLTLLGALDQQGLQAVVTVNGAPDADVLRADVTPVLGPTWAPGDIVVMDHLSAHKALGVQQALARRGVRLRSMPP